MTPDARPVAQHTNIGHSRSGRSKKLQLVHEDYCFMCDGGGDLICCGQCPKVYHLKCAGLDAVPAGAWTCPWHACESCGRTTSVAGGMLFRCTCCPTAYCFDCSPVDMTRLDPSDEFIGGLRERGWDLSKQKSQKAFFMCGDCASTQEIERRAKAERERQSAADAKEKERLRREREEKKRVDDITKEQRAAMQARQAAEKQRLAGIQVQMGDTRRQIEMMYAEGHKQKASLLAQQQEALRVQREQQRKEIAEEEAALAELQRKLHATRTRHQNDARTLHQSHVLAITTMGAELEKEATTLWEHANLPIHHMPRLKGFTLPLAPKSAVLGASTMPPQASALSSANSAAAAQAAAAHAAAAHAAAAAAGLTMPIIPPLGNWWPMAPPGSVLQPNSRNVLQPGSRMPGGSLSMPGSASVPMPMPHAPVPNTTPFGIHPHAGAPTTAPDPNQ